MYSRNRPYGVKVHFSGKRSVNQMRISLVITPVYDGYVASGMEFKETHSQTRQLLLELLDYQADFTEVR